MKSVLRHQTMTWSDGRAVENREHSSRWLVRKGPKPKRTAQYQSHDAKRITRDKGGRSGDEADLARS